MLRRVALVRNEYPPKRRLLQDSHGVTSQKTAFFIVTAVKISNLKIFYIILNYFYKPCNMKDYLYKQRINRAIFISIYIAKIIRNIVIKFTG
jgi:hypothetical protein